ncbi:GFA family protein [Enterovibrio nigricans]|uniref:Uncharacterized conserved protein n=1 Tax=Enterovibrio nigricans DSM 22720 TaxID=1121868 RepID=A0A1T4UID4_9GAMM|nr:GFA family protein [Enterovibrio nigricans]PKF48922.1 GFA family protein [Enterovibrio nigricans]SKA52427.1 Uncharacterized conserved protein [Enterovibrio nigricans DSM 22720]
MSHSTDVLTGQCLCGQIAYEVNQLEPKMGHCHCTMCRKFHGSAFATFGEAKASHFRFTKGGNTLCVYEAENGTKRSFCGTCGSSLLFESSNSDGSLVEFALGTLDSPIAQSPDAHIFTRYAASWYEISDGLPQFSEGRDGDA